MIMNTDSSLKVQFVSDLHLEFASNRKYLSGHPLKKTGDVLVVAGDMYYLDGDFSLIGPFLDSVSENYEKVLIIPGNHEYYGGIDMDSLGDSWKMDLRDNVSYYYNKVVNISGVDFILSTMWSDILPRAASEVRRCLNDFHRIMRGGSVLTVDAYNAEYRKCLSFIKDAVAGSTARAKIVVTHHLPTLKVVAPQHYGSPINSAFAVALDDFIGDSGISYWIYGHSHYDKFARIGDTEIVSNQLGYVDYEGAGQFSRDRFFEI